MIQEKRKKNNKRALYLIVIILAISSLTFRFLNEIEIEQTSILFVGIPALITLLVIKYSKTSDTAYGVVFKTITLFLLMSSILLGEGIVCIIMMAPIFYATGALIVFILKYLNKINKSNLNSFIILPVLFIISQGYEINSKKEILTEQTSIEFKGEKHISNFNKSPDFLKNFPDFFKMGFPKPISIEGSGVNVNDYRKIEFESNTKGIGTLHLKIKESTANNIVFEVVEDNTHINHWLTWKEIDVKIEHTKNASIITWTTYFTCDLGPSWYFKPIEKYGVQTMNEHLINSFFNN